MVAHPRQVAPTLVDAVRALAADRDRGFALERETMNRLIPTPDSQAQLEAFRTRRRARA